MSRRRRRQYGTGSVYQRSSDGRWLGVIQAGWKPNGARRTVTVSAKTEAECKRKLERRKREIEQHGLPESERVTVKAWAEVWLARAEHKLRPSAFSASRSAIRTWIVPEIGHKRLGALTPGDVRQVTAAMRAAGRKPSSALRAHVTLIQMLKAATLEGHPVPQRVLLVERPSVNANDRQAMTAGQAVAVLEVATSLPHASRWVAALLQGLRPQEALGLTWAAVDRRPGFLDISWQLQDLPYVDKRDHAKGFRVPDGFEVRQLEGRLHLTRPKTAKGQRVVPCVPWMTSALEAWRRIAPPSPHDLVWPALDGRPADEAQDLDEWKALQGTAHVSHPAGRYYVRHEARHTTATLLLEAGVDPEVIKQIIGHSTIVSTQAYLHAPERMTLEALSKVAQRLELEA